MIRGYVSEDLSGADIYDGKVTVVNNIPPGVIVGSCFVWVGTTYRYVVFVDEAEVPCQVEVLNDPDRR